MEVTAAKGDWRYGSILSIKVGDTRRQAPLQENTRICFPQDIGDVQQVQVDVFARVGSTRIEIDRRKEVYDLPIEGEGFQNMAIRVRPQEDDTSSLTARRHVESALASEAYADQQDLDCLTSGWVGVCFVDAFFECADPWVKACTMIPHSSCFKVSSAKTQNTKRTRKGQVTQIRREPHTNMP